MCVSLDQIVSPIKAQFDDAWSLLNLNLEEAYEHKPVEFFREFISTVIGLSDEPLVGVRPGKLVCMVYGTSLDLYPLLDAALDASCGSYVVFGAHFCAGYRFRCYKWERHEDGSVSKEAGAPPLDFDEPRVMNHKIGPLVRGMANEVSPPPAETLEGIEFHVLGQGAAVRYSERPDKLSQEDILKLYPIPAF